MGKENTAEAVNGWMDGYLNGGIEISPWAAAIRLGVPKLGRYSYKRQT